MPVKSEQPGIPSEYPRPQLRRRAWQCLNGLWEYAITKDPDMPETFDGAILVPFSPEAPLSGVGRQLQPGERLWYRCRFTPSLKSRRGGKTLLHFGAVDQWTDVFLNGRPVGSHGGGYLPFSCDITDELIDGENELTLSVMDFSDTDDAARGKQKLKRGGIWYTAQSGIWQTVWLETVPRTYISDLKITPLFDLAAVEITVVTSRPAKCFIELMGMRIGVSDGMPVRIPVSGFTPWTPENPYLYKFKVAVGDDRAESYFGMRKFSIGNDAGGVKRMMLNNEPIFYTGVLDQGYWSGGLYTAPSDEAMVADIVAMKKRGFNTLRKHIKIEPLRWYYHCDRLGMIVWQDMVNGGGEYSAPLVSLPLVTGRHKRDNDYAAFGRSDAEGRAAFMRETEETVRLLYNSTSIALWTVFNEGWGQFDAAAAAERVRRLDPTRHIDHASGWHDQGIGDLCSRHVYFKRYRYSPDRRGRVVILTEFGGYNLAVPEHRFNDKDYGYRAFSTPEALLEAYKKLYEREIIPAMEKGLCAAIYTQLSDVEDELNGILTYDRKVEKLPVRELKALNDRLKLK